MVYEGARSINGPYLELLSVNAATLGIIVGLGEFLGYALRLLSGVWADKTKSYWLLTFIGYGLLISVPLLSLAGIWQFAALFILMERIGKAIRSPARDTILSQASSRIGTGFGFGLHEAMDQIGAVTGPLIMSGVFFLAGNERVSISTYQKGYAFLAIPFVFVILCLFVSWRKVPRPEAMEDEKQAPRVPETLSRVFWMYTAFTFAATTGFASFILLAFHFKTTGVLTDIQIPLYYAAAMGIDAVAALSIGKLYDVVKVRVNNINAGLKLLIVIPILTMMMSVFIFSGHHALVIAGILCWGIVMAIHETIMRSAIADITPIKKRGTGYGIFNTTYGLAYLVGSTMLGFLYSHSIGAVITAVICIECLALIMFFFMDREVKRAGVSL
jgi:hypothetical protein